MEAKNILLVAVVGVVSGFLNTVAGGGSLLSMPALIFLGLPSAVANGTNRVAIMAQSIAAVAGFRRKGFFDWTLGLTWGIPAVAGAVVGSRIAVSLADDVFNKMLAVVMLLVMALTLWNPQRRPQAGEVVLGARQRNIGAVVFFFVGIYGGLVQAGVGFIMMAALTLLTGFSLVRINGLKVFVTAVYTVSSLLVFMYSGKVNWVYGLCLAAGSSVGAYLGSVFSVQKGEKWIKVFLVVTVVVSAAKLAGIVNF